MDELNNGVTYVFGENAAVDGKLNGEWILDFVYFKNTPMWNDLFKALREAFWNILKPIIAMFNS